MKIKIAQKFLKDILSEGDKWSLSRILVFSLGICCFLMGAVSVYKAITCPVELNLILPILTLLSTIVFGGKIFSKQGEKKI